MHLFKLTCLPRLLGFQPVLVMGPRGPIRGGRHFWRAQGIQSNDPSGATSLVSECLCLLDRMTVWLSTAPTEPLTHWYQVRCLFQSPLFAKAGDTLSGTCLLIANKRYDLLARAGSAGVCQFGHLTTALLYLSTDRAMTSVLWPRWTRQAPNPVTSWI